LCGSTFGRRKRWRCKEIKERKSRNTREAGSGRKAKNERGVAERKEVVGNGEEEMRKVRQEGRRINIEREQNEKKFGNIEEGVDGVEEVVARGGERG